jgi:hypothetical protein
MLPRGEIADLRNDGQDKVAEALKARYTYRMYDVSEFAKRSAKPVPAQWWVASGVTSAMALSAGLVNQLLG